MLNIVKLPGLWMFLGESQSDPENPESQPDPPSVRTQMTTRTRINLLGVLAALFVPWAVLLGKVSPRKPRLVDPSGPVADPDGPRWAKVYYHVCTLVFPAAIYRTRKDAWLKQRP